MNIKGNNVNRTVFLRFYQRTDNTGDLKRSKPRNRKPTSEHTNKKLKIVIEATLFQTSWDFCTFNLENYIIVLLFRWLSAGDCAQSVQRWITCYRVAAVRCKKLSVLHNAGTISQFYDIPCIYPASIKTFQTTLYCLTTVSPSLKAQWTANGYSFKSFSAYAVQAKSKPQHQACPSLSYFTIRTVHDIKPPRFSTSCGRASPLVGGTVTLIVALN